MTRWQLWLTLLMPHYNVHLSFSHNDFKMLQKDFNLQWMDYHAHEIHFPL